MAYIRPQEVDLTEIDGITVILSTGRGISLFNKEGLAEAELSGWVYEIKTGTSFPIGLILVEDTKKKGHFFVCPAFNMPYHKYAGLPEELAMLCQKVFKKEKAQL